jgi:predicted nucleotidyltransferase
MMTLAQLEQNPQQLLLKCISGSRAYGLETATSDTDIKGVFILPKSTLYGLNYTMQVNNDTNDEMYYELGRLIDLAVKSNPNILELLFTPEESVLYRHPVMKALDPQRFLSKQCYGAFAGYAQTQVRKARGLNKKINQPVAEVRKSLTDFCYVVQGAQSVPLAQWLQERCMVQEDCALSAVPHMRDTYFLFHRFQHADTGWVRGILKDETHNEVVLSSVPRDLQPLTVLYVNKDGYSMHCRHYREYQDWLAHRNEHRYQQTLEHGKNYDAKNLMHTFRLLAMAEEIAREQTIHVRRPDRAFLLQVRSGHYTYDALLAMADERLERIREAYEQSRLPDNPDMTYAEQLLVYMRETLYSTSFKW